MTLCEAILNVMDPFGVIRSRLVKPTVEFSLAMYEHYRSRTKEGVLSIRDLIFRMAIVALAIATIIWTAVFMYVAFYYTYMPASAHSRHPVHIQFKTCTDGLCSFPHAHVSLTKKHQVMMVGQSYRIVVNIDMPESPPNQNLGMFMICADLRDSSSKLRDHSCRSAMLRYKSQLLQYISTWLLSPLFIAGVREERQTISVELFSGYNEDQLHPVTDVYIEIQSKMIQFYEVSLHIIADFTGLRYIMFHWPLLSAALGISTNLFFIIVIFLLSWYHWSDTDWIADARDHYSKVRQTKSDLSTSIDTVNILDDDELSILGEISSNKSDDIEEVSGVSVVDGVGDGEDAAGGEIRQRKITQAEYEF